MGELTRERYTVPQWFDEVGSKPPFDFTSIAYVYHCCRERKDPRTGRVDKLPGGWRAEKDETFNRWFIYPEILLPQNKTKKRAEIKSVQDDYNSVKLDSLLISELEGQLRQVILHGLPRRIVIEFIPEPRSPIVYNVSTKTTNNTDLKNPIMVTQWFSKRVGQIFNKYGKEISLGNNATSEEYYYQPPAQMEFLLSQWWRLNALQNDRNTSKRKEFQQLKKELEDYLPHKPTYDKWVDALEELWKCCIWCGKENREIDPNRRVDAKYCCDEHKTKFNTWMEKLKNSTIREDEFRSHIEEIRLTLAT